jgi:hypothetical protein
MRITVRQLKRLIREAVANEDNDYTDLYNTMPSTHYIDEFMNYANGAELSTIFDAAAMVCKSGQYRSA